MVAEQEDVGARVHPVAQPAGGVHRITRLVVEVVKVIPEINDVIVIMGMQPVVGVPRVVVNVRNDQRAHCIGLGANTASLPCESMSRSVTKFSL